MSRWFRYYDDAMNDPKVQRLSGDLFKAWVNLLCLASRSGGKIKNISEAAFALRLSEAKAGAVVSELASQELLDPVTGGYFEPHNWDKRQFKSDVSNERVKRHRKRECNVTDTVTETPPDNRDRTEKKDAANAALPSDLEKQLFSRGKEIAGKDAGGLIVKLLKAKKGDVALARSAVELASTKQNPREFIAAIVQGGKASVEGRRLTNDEEYYGTGRIPGVV